MVSALRRRLAVGAIATFFGSALAFLGPGVAYAANYSFTVIGTGDGVGNCSPTTHHCTTLRAAFNFANDLSGTNMVSVELPAGTYSLHQGELALTKGGLTFDLVGAGSATTIVTRASTAEDARILRVCAPSGVAGGCLASQTVHLSGITISNGRLVNDVGAGIANGAFMTNGAATMTLTDVTVHSNRIQVTNGTDTAPNGGVGAGIFNRGSLTLTNSTVSGNSISPDSDAPANLTVVGAGIQSAGGSLTVDRTSVTGNTLGGCADTCGVGSAGIQSRNEPLTIKDSTISGNTGTNGSGGVSTGGNFAASITNSTISENSAPGGLGGGFFQVGFGSGIATLVNVTIANNSAPDGGGIKNFGAPSKVVLKNSIIANNTGGNCSGGGNSGVTSGGYNLDSGTTCDLTGVGDITDTNPKLGSLTSNGGPTRTRALLAGSPAIDAVASAACPPPAADQRGVTRPQGPRCDMGAFEVVQPKTYTIGVDNASPSGHNYQYVDYFPRNGTTIHDGDVLDFRWNAGSLDGFHTATLLGADESPSPAVYQEPNNQLVVPDSDDGAGKLQLNTSVLFPSDPACGHSAAGACRYDGDGDLNSGAFPNTVPTGAPQPEFFVKVQLPLEGPLTSPQTIHFVCLIHLFMAGSVTVVPDTTPTSTAASVAAASAAQKTADDAEVAPKIAAANASWTTNHVVTAGTASQHVEVLEMVPNTVSIIRGTSVKWVTQTIRDVHTVTFPQGSGSNPVDPIPFMCEETGTTDSQPTGPPAPPNFGCSSPAVVEAHFIPGPQGATSIASTSTVGSSGILANPPAPYPNNYTFSFPNAGTFAYQCRIHDHMTGTVVASVPPPVLAQTGAPKPGVPIVVLLAGALLFLLGLGLRRPFRIIP